MLSNSHPLYGMGPGGFTGPGVMTVDKEAPAETDWQKIVIHLGGSGKRGGGMRGDGEINSEKAEQGRAVNSYAIVSGYMW